MSQHSTDPARFDSRARHLLPEEQSAGSEDPQTQAEAILHESDVREDDPQAAPDSFLERRTSEQATGQEPTD